MLLCFHVLWLLYFFALSLALSHSHMRIILFLTSRMTTAKDSFETSTIWMRRMVMVIMMMMVAMLMVMRVHRACHVDRHWGSRCQLLVTKTRNWYSTGWNVLKMLAKRIRMNTTEQVDRSQSQDDPGRSVRFPSTAEKNSNNQFDRDPFRGATYFLECSIAKFNRIRRTLLNFCHTNLHNQFEFKLEAGETSKSNNARVGDIHHSSSRVRFERTCSFHWDFVHVDERPISSGQQRRRRRTRWSRLLFVGKENYFCSCVLIDNGVSVDIVTITHSATDCLTVEGQKREILEQYRVQCSEKMAPSGTYTHQCRLQCLITQILDKHVDLARRACIDNEIG